MTVPGNSSAIPIDWRNLIRAGRDLINPRQLGSSATDEHVRRAASNTYYALFHALAESNASVLIGAPNDPLTASAWSRVYRGLDHATVRRELQRHRQEFSAPARSFADWFADMQEVRHSADYDHDAVMTINQAREWLYRTESTVLDFLQTSVNEKRFIAAWTLIRPR